MYAGTPPFLKATLNDPYYRLVAKGNLDTFWKAHAKYKNPNPGYYSNEFMDLISNMLKFNP